MRHTWLVPILTAALGGGALAHALFAQQAAPAPAPAPAPAAATPAQSAPAAPATTPAPRSSSTPTDPTRADDRLRQLLKSAPGGQAVSLGSVALRGLVVSADGTASAIVSIGSRFAKVTRDGLIALDASGFRRARVVSLDASGLALEDLTTGERIQLN